MDNNGGPAFPTFEMVEEYHEGKQQFIARPHALSGMSLRDYFAAKAMQAMVCADADNGRFRDGAGRTAEFAYVVADAMLAEREKRA